MPTPVEFDIDNNRLSGSVGHIVNQWTSIESLNMGLNRFNGTILDDLIPLSLLRIFEGSQNSFSGTLPPELADLNFLSIFNIAFNDMDGTLPTEYGEIISLEHLMIRNNDFVSTLPTEYGNLKNLGKWNFITHFFVIFFLSSSLAQQYFLFGNMQQSS